MLKRKNKNIEDIIYVDVTNKNNDDILIELNEHYKKGYIYDKQIHLKDTKTQYPRTFLILKNKLYS